MLVQHFLSSRYKPHGLRKQSNLKIKKKKVTSLLYQNAEHRVKSLLQGCAIGTLQFLREVSECCPSPSKKLPGLAFTTRRASKVYHCGDALWSVFFFFSHSRENPLTNSAGMWDGHDATPCIVHFNCAENNCSCHPRHVESSLHNEQIL